MHKIICYSCTIVKFFICKGYSFIVAVKHYTLLYNIYLQLILYRIVCVPLNPLPRYCASPFPAPYWQPLACLLYL